MRFSTSAKALKAALRTAKSATEKRNVMPILACVRIEVANKGVTLTTTDLEIGLIVDVGEVVACRKGVAVVPLKALAAAIKPLKSEVTLEADKEHLTVSDGQCSVSLASHFTCDYPTLPEAQWPESCDTQPLEGLRHAIGAVAHAASIDETRYNLNGIAIDADVGHCIATDGHRLAVADAGSIKLPWKGIQIIPLKPALVLAKLLKGSSDPARVFFDGTIMAFQGEKFEISIRCIEGEYPNYQQVIPKKIAETVKVDRDALLNGIASVEHCAAERSRAVKITLDGGLGLDTSNPDLGSASAHMDAVRGRYEADTVKTLALNHRYLTDALKVLDAGEISIGFGETADLGPISLRGSGEFPLCVVMPMRL